MSSSTTTVYRYITTSPDICGGSPIIRGTRTPVRAIVGYHRLGLDVDEILDGLPSLTPAQVYEALSYYYDHQSEIDQDIEANQIKTLIKRHGLRLAPDGHVTIPERHEP